MSNGDSLDGFVFPPFIPTASTRPAQAPPAAPQPSIQEPAPAPAADAAGRMTMPWDLETPIVRDADADAAPARPAAAAADDDEDLPWLEVPAPRDAEAPAAEAPPAAQDDAFPEWLAWDQRDGVAAEADARDSVAPIAGLEDFVPADDLGSFVAPPPAMEWAEAEPEASASTPQADAGSEAAPVFEAAPDAEPFPELVFDDAPAAEPDAAEDWSLAAPEAAEPPSVLEAPAPAFEESPAAAEPSFEVSVDDGALSFEPAAADAQPFVADDEAVMAAEPEPFAADAFAAPAAERQPFVADEEAVIASEPDPFTAASVAEAESVAPAASAPADSPFDDVAARLEAIARMLRERPDELLAGGSSDPLALLVTGYVMGYTARGGR
jgi:hypothetical protein